MKEFTEKEKTIDKAEHHVKTKLIKNKLFY